MDLFFQMSIAHPAMQGHFFFFAARAKKGCPAFALDWEGKEEHTHA